MSAPDLRGFGFGRGLGAMGGVLWVVKGEECSGVFSGSAGLFSSEEGCKTSKTNQKHTF